MKILRRLTTRQARVLVEPHVVETPVVVERVVVQDETLDVWLPAQASYALGHDRPGLVLCKLSLNRLDQLASVLQIGLPRLLVNQLLDLGITILGIVALRAAGVAFVERCADPLRNALGAMPPTSVINWNRATYTALRVVMSKPVRLLACDTN